MCTCSCVWLKSEHLFSEQMRWKRAFTSASSFPCAKVLVCWTINAFVFCLEGGLEITWKGTESRGKSFPKTSFYLRIEPEKGTETRLRWSNARRQPDICCVFLQISSCLLALLHLSLVSVPFFRSDSWVKWSFRETFPYILLVSLRWWCALFTCVCGDVLRNFIGLLNMYYLDHTSYGFVRINAWSSASEFRGRSSRD